MSVNEMAVVQVYKEGKTYKQIIKQFHIASNTLVNIIKKYGVRRAIGDHNMDKSKINIIIEEYKAGISQKQIAKKYKTSPHTIRKILKENRINIRGRGSHGLQIPEPTQSEIEQMAKEHMSGKSVAKIARKYGYPEIKLHLYLQTAEIDWYDYDDYVVRHNKHGEEWSDLKINNRYLFYQTMVDLGMAKEDILNKLDEITKGA